MSHPVHPNSVQNPPAYGQGQPAYGPGRILKHYGVLETSSVAFTLLLPYCIHLLRARAILTTARFSVLPSAATGTNWCVVQSVMANNANIVQSTP